MVISVVQASVTFALVALIDPAFPFNDGMWRSVDLKFAERTVVSPEYPAPVGNCTQSMHRLMDLLVEVLGKFQSDKGVAHSGGSGGTLAVSWPAGVVGPHAYTHYEILGAATAGSNQGDGESGIATNSSSNLFLAPIEVVETAAPIRLKTFEMVPDSGGPGKFRGGLSYRRTYEVLEAAKLNRRADRVKIASSGSAGGGPGRRGEFTMNPGLDTQESFGGSGFYDLEQGQTFAVAGSGGGGYGNPFERDVAAILEDVRAGWVSVEGAARDYGVVIVDRTVDERATSALRSAPRTA
jgi:N-methylhydantoinase B